MAPIPSAAAERVARLRSLAQRHRVLLALGLALAVAACGGAWLASGGVRSALATAAGVDPRRALLAGIFFAAAPAATAASWRLAFRALGASVGGLDACAWFAGGSLVNTVCPAPVGDGVRAAVFSRALPQRDGRVLRAAGALGALTVSRAVVQAALIGSASLLGVVPRWPVLVLAALAALGVAAAVVLDRRAGAGRLARLTEATAVMVRSPRLGLGLIGWSAAAAAAKVAAAAAVASAFGVSHPWVAALAIAAALDLAAALPLTPGGIGLTSGAVSLALASRGIGFSTALAAGVVFHVLETASSLAFAGVAIPLAARPRLLARPALRVGVALVAIAVVAAASAPSLRGLA